MIKKLADGVSGWHSKMTFPKDNYTLRCLEEEFSPSKSTGNPMVTREWEIVCPNPVEIDGRQIDIDGLKITQRTMVGNLQDEQKDAKAFGRFSEELKVLGFEGEDIDTENPPLIAKGKVVYAIVYGKEDVSRKSPTPEQKKKGQLGDPIKGPDGKDIKTYQLNIETILGLSTTEINRPF